MFFTRLDYNPHWSVDHSALFKNITKYHEYPLVCRLWLSCPVTMCTVLPICKSVSKLSNCVCTFSTKILNVIL